MKVATVTYTGRKGDHTRKMPDGEKLRFRARHKDDPGVDLESVDYAEQLETKPNYEVDWTARGRIYVSGSSILELGYQKKRSLASDLDLSFDGQPDEDELDDAIEDMVETLKQQGGP